VSEDFMAVKESLDIADVASRYGVHVVRHNKAHCPFHTDRTPSMSFYDENRKFHCFSCGEHGDSIDLVQKLLNLSKTEALRELNDSYRLGLDLDTPPAPEKVRRAILQRRQRRQEKENFDRWEKGCFSIFRAYFHALRDWREMYAPKSPDEPLHPRFIEALHRQDYIEYLMDAVFISGSRESKMAFFKSHEGTIRAVEQHLIREGIPYAHRNGAGACPPAGFRPILIEGGRRPAAAA